MAAFLDELMEREAVNIIAKEALALGTLVRHIPSVAAVLSQPFMGQASVTFEFRTKPTPSDRGWAWRVVLDAHRFEQHWAYGDVQQLVRPTPEAALQEAVPQLEALLREIAAALAVRDLDHNGPPDSIIAKVRTAVQTALRPIDEARMRTEAGRRFSELMDRAPRKGGV